MCWRRQARYTCGLVCRGISGVRGGRVYQCKCIINATQRVSGCCTCHIYKLRCWGVAWGEIIPRGTVYPKKYAHGLVVLCFVVVMQSFIMNSHEVFIHIHQGCFASPGAIVRLPQCQWSKPDGYMKISPCRTTSKHNKEKTVCIFLGI